MRRCTVITSRVFLPVLCHERMQSRAKSWSQHFLPEAFLLYCRPTIQAVCVVLAEEYRVSVPTH